MADQTSSPKDAEKSRNVRSEKKQEPKQKAPSFSEPAAFVTFIIGKGEKPTKFLVHKEFACYYSPVLEAAFNSEFVEGQTQTYRLEDTTEQAFRLLVQWFYSQKFGLTLGDFHRDNETPDDELLNALKAEEQSLAELWVLADKICIPALQNLVIDTMFKVSSARNWIPVFTYSYIYKNTNSGSALRRLAVTQTAYGMTEENLLKFSEAYSPQILLDLSAFLLRTIHMQDKALFPDPWDIDTSDFHVPLDGTSTSQ